MNKLELTNEEIQRLMDQIKTSRNATRDRLILNLKLKAGMKTAHIAHMKIGDVITKDGDIRNQIRTEKCTALLDLQLRVDILSYIQERFKRSVTDVAHLNQTLSGHLYDLNLITSQKRGYFDEWTLASYLRKLYRSAGVDRSVSSARITYLCRLSKSGLTLGQITKVSGISAETLARYLHESEVDEREVIENM